jgi:uncharacterized protein YcfJ
MTRPLTLALAALLMLVASSVRGENVVAQPAHVRTEYAEVLRVEPVYQTLRAYATEERCDPVDNKPGLRDAVSVVQVASLSDKGSKGRNCRMVRVPREFRRPVAYDVEYVHRGVKYRSRLPFDPGKRLKVKVTVAPDIGSDRKR